MNFFHSIFPCANIFFIFTWPPPPISFLMVHPTTRFTEADRPCIFILGGWIKIDSHQVPKQYFGYFITKLGVQVNAVRKVCHRGQPCYQSATLKVSYKLFRLEQLVSALEEQPLVSLQRQLLFEGNEISSSQGDLSAEDEIARAKARVHTPAEKKKRRPSSKSLLQVGLGEGRATREVEIIWWPNVYTVTEHGQMIIRMYVQKCDF